MARIQARRSLDDLASGRTRLSGNPSGAMDQLYGLVLGATGDEEQARDAVQRLAWEFAKHRGKSSQGGGG
jgi:hypothetical protein